MLKLKVKMKAHEVTHQRSLLVTLQQILDQSYRSVKIDSRRVQCDTDRCQPTFQQWDDIIKEGVVGVRGVGYGFVTVNNPLWSVEVTQKVVIAMRLELETIRRGVAVQNRSTNGKKERGKTMSSTVKVLLIDSIDDGVSQPACVKRAWWGL